MKITDLRCAVIGKHPIVRIVTDEGHRGLGEIEFTRAYIKGAAFPRGVGAPLPAAGGLARDGHFGA